MDGPDPSNPPAKTTTSSSFQILVCDGPSCGVMHESDRLVDCLQASLRQRPDLQGRVAVVNFTCFGRCDDGPNMFVRTCAPGEDPADDSGVDLDDFSAARGFYPGMDEGKVLRVLEQHCVEGRIVDDLVDDY